MWGLSVLRLTLAIIQKESEREFGAVNGFFRTAERRGKRRDEILTFEEKRMR
jgi:hypothetical protein